MKVRCQEFVQLWSDQKIKLEVEGAGAPVPIAGDANGDYSFQNDESLHEHCTNERRVRKRDKKVRRDVI